MTLPEDRVALGRVLLGQSIRERRERADLTMRDLSALSGLSYDTITSVEYGRVLASLRVLDRIGQALGTTARGLLTDVFPWDGGEPPTTGD